jgi:hypothetical protein
MPPLVIGWAGPDGGDHHPRVPPDDVAADQQDREGLVLEQPVAERSGVAPGVERVDVG